MSVPGEGELFTPEQQAELARAKRLFIGRDGSITLRYKRGELHRITYCVPGQAHDLKEAVEKLKGGGGYGNIIITHTPGGTQIDVEVSREYPLKPKGKTG